MTIFDLPSVPQRVQMGIRSNTARFPSPLTGTVQTVDRGGAAWLASLTWNAVSGADRAELMALVAELKGQSNRLRVPAFDNPKRGAYGGTPTVSAARAAGVSEVPVTGGAASVTNWIRRGDYFAIVVNGEPELKICTADASTSAGGAIASLTFEPPLRAAVAGGEALWVEDGVLQRPQGVFMQSEVETVWQSGPGIGSDRFSSFSLALVEDLLATQA